MNREKFWICNYCGYVRHKEEEVMCWKCGKGEMIYKRTENMNKLKTFISRFTGYVYGPYSDFLRNPDKYGGVLGSHIESQWTGNEHFAHSNYNRGHLPQLCIVASGWKARLLSLFFWPKPPFIPETEYIVWWKNGDHPKDNVWRRFEDTGKKPIEPREGAVVRYYRHPNVDGKFVCDDCGYTMHDHGWIDNGGDGETVCPGSYVKI